MDDFVNAPVNLWDVVGYVDKIMMFSHKRIGK